jgi:hypoxanthine-DNA glycosylase
VSVKVGLPPVANADARLLLLGSLPGDASIVASQYYAHSTNQFWRLLGAAIGEELQPLPYAMRLERLGSRRIALWDVIAAAHRRGSLDQAIRLAEHNRVGDLLRRLPELRAIGFNGATAAASGRRLIGPVPSRLTLIDLPSSSAANTMPFADKLAAWRQLKSFIL